MNVGSILGPRDIILGECWNILGPFDIILEMYRIFASGCADHPHKNSHPQLHPQNCYKRKYWDVKKNMYKYCINHSTLDLKNL